MELGDKLIAALWLVCIAAQGFALTAFIRKKLTGRFLLLTVLIASDIVLSVVGMMLEMFAGGKAYAGFWAATEPVPLATYAGATLEAYFLQAKCSSSRRWLAIVLGGFFTFTSLVLVAAACGAGAESWGKSNAVLFVTRYYSASCLLFPLLSQAYFHLTVDRMPHNLRCSVGILQLLLFAQSVSYWMNETYACRLWQASQLVLLGTAILCSLGWGILLRPEGNALPSPSRRPALRKQAGYAVLRSTLGIWPY